MWSILIHTKLNLGNANGLPTKYHISNRYVVNWCTDVNLRTKSRAWSNYCNDNSHTKSTIYLVYSSVTTDIKRDAEN